MKPLLPCRKIAYLATFVASGFAAHSTQAALLVYDSFDYPAGAILGGQSGGSGWTGAWGGTATAITTTANSLSYGSLVTQGNKIELAPPTGTTTSSTRSTATYGGAGTDIWMSFLIAANGGSEGVSLFSGGGELTFFGTPGTNNYGVRYYGGVTNRPVATTADQYFEPGAPGSRVVADGATHFMVIQIDQTGLSPVYRAWLDPDVASLGTGTAPTGGLTRTLDTGTQFFNFNAVRVGDFSGSTSSTMDEIRIGTSWVDVSPIPEPSTSLALATAGLLVLFRRRRA